MASSVATQKNRRKLRYSIAVVGFLLVALELMLAYKAVALYQSLAFSIYLLFNILVDVDAWIERYWLREYGRRIRIHEARFIGGVILIPFWMLLSLLLGLIAPMVSLEAIYVWSALVVIVLTVLASVPDYVTKERSFSEKKRRAVRRAIGVSLILIIPYVSVMLTLSALGLLPHVIQPLAILAFLPLIFFTLVFAGGIARRSPLKETMEGGVFLVMVTIVPFVVAGFIALPIYSKIPYLCGSVAAYVAFIYWLRSVRAKNRQERERKALNRVNQ
jgi:hypothetical protein